MFFKKDRLPIGAQRKSHSLTLSRVQKFALVVIICISTYATFFMTSSTSNNGIIISKTFSYIPEALEEPADIHLSQETMTIVMIALDGDDPNGPDYHDWATLACKALRTNGKYHGKIVILTDKYEKLQTAEKEYGANIVKLDVDGSKLDPMQAKGHKMYITDYVKAPYILYIDTDILMGGPIDPFINTMKGPMTYSSLAFFRSKNQIKKFTQPYHGGLWLLRTNYAKGHGEYWLKRWREEMEKGVHARDQLALASALRGSIERGSISIIPKEFIIFPSSKQLKDTQIATFVHITFTGTMLNAEAAMIKSFINNALQLDTTGIHIGRRDQEI